MSDPLHTSRSSQSASVASIVNRIRELEAAALNVLAQPKSKAMAQVLATTIEGRCDVVCQRLEEWDVLDGTVDAEALDLLSHLEAMLPSANYWAAKTFKRRIKRRVDKLRHVSVPATLEQCATQFEDAVAQFLFHLDEGPRGRRHGQGVPPLLTSAPGLSPATPSFPDTPSQSPISLIGAIYADQPGHDDAEKKYTPESRIADSGIAPVLGSGVGGCYPGTRTNVLAAVSEFVFERQFEGVLWISGEAGSGKSAIATSAVQQHEAAGSVVIVFRFDRGDQRWNSSVFRVLLLRLAQITGSSTAAMDEVEEVSLSFVSKLETLVNNFRSTQHTTLLIAIDGLDEWIDPVNAPTLIKCIRSVAASSQPRCKFLVTSRALPILTEAFEKAEGGVVRRLSLDEPSYKSADSMRLILETRLERTKMSHASALPPSWPGQDILQQLSDQSRGSYQWAVTASAFINEGEPEVNLSAVANLGCAGELDVLYAAIFQYIFTDEDANRRLLKLVLESMITSVRPLCWDELAYLYSVGQSGTDLEPEVLRPLGVFISPPQNTTVPIRFRHASISELFSSSGAQQTLSSTHQKRNAELAGNCLRQMGRDLHRDMLNIGVKLYWGDGLQERTHRLLPSGLQYACSFWAEHLMSVGLDAEAREEVHLLALLTEFCELHILSWIETMACMGALGDAKDALERAELWILSIGTFPGRQDLCTSLALLRDARRVVSTFIEPLRKSPLQVYTCVSSFLPVSSPLKSHYSEMLGQPLHILTGKIPKFWPEEAWTSDQSMDIVGLGNDAQQVAAASPDGVINFYNSGTGDKADSSLQSATTVLALAVSPITRTIAVGTKARGICLWHLKSGHTATLDDGMWVFAVAFSPDGSTLASASNFRSITLWDTLSGISKGEPLEGHEALVWSLAFSPNGKTLVSGSDDCTVRVWSVELMKMSVEPLRGHAQGVRSVAFCPDAITVASGSDDHTIRLWNVELGTAIRVIVGHTAWVRTVAFSGDGRTLVSGSLDRTVRLWDVATGQPMCKPYRGHILPVNSIISFPSTNSFVSGSQDGTVRMLNARTPQEVSHPDADIQTVTAVALSPNGDVVLTGSSDSALRLWNTMTGELVVPPIMDPNGSVLCVAFSPDGTMIASASSDCTLCLRVATAPNNTICCFQHAAAVISVTFSPDGGAIASFASDGTLSLWDIPSSECVAKTTFNEEELSLCQEHPPKLAFLDTNTIIWFTPQLAMSWDVSTRLCVGTFVQMGFDDEGIFCMGDIVFGRRLAWIVQRDTEGSGLQVRETPLPKALDRAMRAGVVVPLQIDQAGWILLGDRPLLWLPEHFGRAVECWWSKGRIVVLNGDALFVLDASNLEWIIE